jgi:hypothetical protein
MAARIESVKQRDDRELLERIIEERDRLYDMRFRAGEIAVNAALAAQEKAVTSAFIASEKAIIKAEEAQREYNVRSNEFRGQLDDQAKLLMSRAEANAVLESLSDKVEALRVSMESRLESQRLAFEKVYDNLNKEIAGLRESRSQHEGRGISQREITGYILAAIGVTMGLVSLYFKSLG